MSFRTLVKGSEFAYICKLMTIFGAVEERQMRRLYDFLDDKEYGRLMTRLKREGFFYRTPDARYLASTRIMLNKVNISASVDCFWAFLELKDKVHDFCAGEAPALISMATKASVYDMIPVTGKNAQQINDSIDEIPERSIRFFVTRDLDLLTGIERRIKNDYAIHVDEDGVLETYEL